ncbi:hypothetical protein LSCM1_03545 [Leishmania martiniquensis]|uniref:Uncharacterized protein n=1 Tax=Leishmania martiniquensis TaxID=1580590 RepID=A0A836H5F0_9TRYP|nr:hypothetical protein LSCM1_03545 [Leishmania martiniquensis]
MIFGNEPPFHLKPIPYRGVRKHEAEVLQHPPGYQHPIIPLPPFPAPNSDASGPAVSSSAAHVSRSPAAMSPAPSVKPSATEETAWGASSSSRTVHPTVGCGLAIAAPPHLLQQQQHNPRERCDSGRGGDAFLPDAQRLDPDMTVDAALRQERAQECRKRLGYQQARRNRAATREATLRASRNAAFHAEQRRLATVAGTARSNREQDDRDPITHQCYTAEAEHKLIDVDTEVRSRYAARQRFLDRQMNSTEYNILTWQLR